jgi:sporulation protein YlmC with PRC-barrel domain
VWALIVPDPRSSAWSAVNGARACHGPREAPADEDHRGGPAGDSDRGHEADRRHGARRDVDTPQSSARRRPPESPRRDDVAAAANAEGQGRMRLELGTPVVCAGDVVGEIADAVIDPETLRLTHVVVQTGDKQARLVPTELLTDGRDGEREVSLTCTLERLRELESIRGFAFVRFDEFPASDAESDVGIEDMFAMPYYESGEFGDYAGEFGSSVAVTYDRIPKGEVEIRRSSEVLSADGHHLGRADGFVLREGKVTHVVLERGHWWWTRDVAIPVEAVEVIETDSVTLNLSKDEVSALPAIRAHRRPFSY